MTTSTGCAPSCRRAPDWAFVNVNVRTYYAEGSKTLAFEVAEQLGWQAPDHVVVPVASGSQLTKVAKGFRELFAGRAARRGAARAGLGRPGRRLLPGRHRLRRRPDVVQAGEAGHHRQVAGHREPGRRRLRPRRGADSGGSIGSVTDDEIVAGIRLLARTEGIFAETAGGVTIATLAKLAASGVVRPDERVVAYVTGNGLKTLDAVRPCYRPDRHDRPDPRGLRRSRRRCRNEVP